MSIITVFEETPRMWRAYCSDEFDGADDAAPFPEGWGRTEADAIADLREKQDERDADSQPEGRT